MLTDRPTHTHSYNVYKNTHSHFENSYVRIETYCNHYHHQVKSSVCVCVFKVLKGVPKQQQQEEAEEGGGEGGEGGEGGGGSEPRELGKDTKDGTNAKN